MAFSAPEPGDAATTTTAGCHERDIHEHRPTPLLAALGPGTPPCGRRPGVRRRLAAAASRRRPCSTASRSCPPSSGACAPGSPATSCATHWRPTARRSRRAYAQFAGRGEQTWDKLREKPPVRQAITTLGSYTEKLDSRVDEAQEAASRALAAASRQTRATGEKVAKAGQRISGRAADAVVDVSAVASDAVEDAGTAAAEVIEEAGDEAATATRKANGKTPAKATPRTVAPQPADPHPASE
jgi:heparin binding hemagglutinin HbhA